MSFVPKPKNTWTSSPATLEIPFAAGRYLWWYPKSDNRFIEAAWDLITETTTWLITRFGKQWTRAFIQGRAYAYWNK